LEKILIESFEVRDELLSQTGLWRFFCVTIFGPLLRVKEYEYHKTVCYQKIKTARLSGEFKKLTISEDVMPQITSALSQNLTIYA